MANNEKQPGHFRVLKFRAWNRGSKKMCYPEETNEHISYFTFYSEGNWELNEVSGSAKKLEERPLLYSSDGVLMQYTGLKDKNRKEIWEGDILQDEDDCYTVVEYGLQEVDAFEGIGFNIWTFMDGTTADGKRLQETFEIIGNIYENPDLLKENKKQNNEHS